jgi:hypothetical protein
VPALSTQTATVRPVAAVFRALVEVPLAPELFFADAVCFMPRAISPSRIRPSFSRILETPFIFLHPALVLPFINTVTHRGQRGARLARREEGEYREYVTDRSALPTRGQNEMTDRSSHPVLGPGQWSSELGEPVLGSPWWSGDPAEQSSAQRNLSVQIIRCVVDRRDQHVHVTRSPGQRKICG